MSTRLRRAMSLRTQAAWLADNGGMDGLLLGGKHLRTIMREADDAYEDLDHLERAAYCEWNRPAVEAVLNDPAFKEAARDVWGLFFGDRSDA